MIDSMQASKMQPALLAAIDAVVADKERRTGRPLVQDDWDGSDADAQREAMLRGAETVLGHAPTPIEMRLMKGILDQAFAKLEARGRATGKRYTLADVAEVIRGFTVLEP